MIKNCKLCSKEFQFKTHSEKYCSFQCRIIVNKKSIQKYNRSQKAKEARKRYWKKNEGKMKKYHQEYHKGYVLKNKYALLDKRIISFECLVCSYQWRRVRWVEKNLKQQNIFYPFICPNCKKKCWDFGDNIKCRVCEKNILFPHIHHKDGIHTNNYFSNRIPVCSRCHPMIHNIDFSDLKRQSKSSLKRINFESINRLKEFQRELK